MSAARRSIYSEGSCVAAFAVGRSEGFLTLHGFDSDNALNLGDEYRRYRHCYGIATALLLQARTLVVEVVLSVLSKNLPCR